MPDLEFKVTGVAPVKSGLTPLLHFNLHVTNQQSPAGALEQIQALILQVQIQIQAPQRNYSAGEKERILDIFGTPAQWSETMRNRVWTIANLTTGSFVESIETALAVPCTIDLDVLATKYFKGLDGGEVPLLFLFSGSVFYRIEKGNLQVQRIPWEKEAVYKMPVRVWQDLMDFHFPNSACLSLRRDLYDRLCAYRRESGWTSWEETIEQLLPGIASVEVKA